MWDIFTYEFGLLALLGGILSAIMTSLLGTVVVLRRMSFFGSGIAHLSFAGVGLALLLKLPVNLITVTVAAVSAVVLGYLSRKGVHEDIGVGVLFSTSMALGIVMISASGVDSSRVMAYLFGDILAITWSDIWLLTILCAAVVIFMIVFKDHLIYMTFDEDFMKVLRAKTTPVYYTYLVLLAVSIVFSINLLGIILISAMIVLPAASSSLVSRTYQGMLKLSPVISSLSVLVGLIVAWNFDVPAGASIVLVQGVVFFFTFLIKILGG